jgi:hypothetical protein
MPRTARIIAPCYSHTPYDPAGANNFADVFFDDEDSATCLSLLKDFRARFSVEIRVYCPMTHHVHILAAPSDVDRLVTGSGFLDDTGSDAPKMFIRQKDSHIDQNQELGFLRPFLRVKKHREAHVHKRLILTHHKNLLVGNYLIDDRTRPALKVWECEGE